MQRGVMTCGSCLRTVASAAFCLHCGADLTNPDGDGRNRLRLAHYAAAPREHVLRFAVASSLFPQVPPTSRRALRLGLLVVAAALVGFTVAGWQAPLIGAAVLGLPLLFALYLRAAAIHPDLPRRWLTLTVGLGVVLGVMWGLIGGPMVARAADVGLGGSRAVGSILVESFVFPLAGAMLMLAPAVAVWAMQPRVRDSLDGFAVGALGALVFTAASTLTRLAPQLATGPWTDGQPMGPILAEAGIRGLAMPVIAAAVGGLVGIAIWFARPVRAIPLALTAAVSIYLALGFVQTLRVRDDFQLLLHLAIAGLTLLVLRIGVQVALLHEVHDEVTTSEPVLCSYCDHVVPAAAFCPRCGVATRAASRSSRAARRAYPPGEPPVGARPQLGYAMPADTYQAVPVRHSTRARVAAVMGAGLGIAAAAAFVVSFAITPAGVQRYICPPDCGRPPMGVPVAASPRFVSSHGEFSVNYPAPGTAYRADTDPNGVVLDYIAGDTGTMELFGQPSVGRSARQITEQILTRSYPDAVVEYEIPNATVGYQQGYGVVADVYPTDPDATYTRLRILVLTAVKNDYALVASAVGPFHRFSPDFGSGHPSGANLELALDMGKYVNSFMWQGDPPR